jgi:hypothetical protein
MRNFVRSRLRQICAGAIALGLTMNLAYAEISLDHQFPWTEAQVGFALEGAGYFAEAINRDQVALGFERQSFGTLNFFRMLWNERVYYVAGAQIRSKEQNAVRDAALARNKNSLPIPGGGICTLFVYDKDLKQAAKHDVKLNEANGHTWCNDARALARVKGQDALLFAISYYLTDKPLAKRQQDIGDGWRYMTVLLKLREQDGKVFIEQDDGCLGNPNGFSDLGAARKALTACK